MFGKQQKAINFCNALANIDVGIHYKSISMYLIYFWHGAAELRGVTREVKLEIEWFIVVINSAPVRVAGFRMSCVRDTGRKKKDYARELLTTPWTSTILGFTSDVTSFPPRMRNVKVTLVFEHRKKFATFHSASDINAYALRISGNSVFTAVSLQTTAT